jgi:uncharacterized membrane protein YdbT with pleckstrin-like domain
MSYIDRHLMEGERVLFRTRLHWKSMVVPVVVCVLLVALGATAFLTPMPWLAVIPALLGVVWVLAAAVRRRSSEFAVTDRRIVLKVGVFTTSSVEILHSRIESVAVKQGVGGRLFDYGRIEVVGSGGTREVFDGIQSPLEFRNAISAAAGQAPARA